jgi:hypothetical protein
MIVFLAASAIIIYNKLTGHVGKAQYAATVTWSELVPLLPSIFLSALFFAVIAYILTLWEETRREPDEH